MKKLKKTQLHSIRTEKFKFIGNALGDQRELYDIVSDPLETKNLFAGETESVQEYDEKIRKELGDFTQTQTVPYDSDVIEQLKSLGYVD